MLDSQLATVSRPDLRSEDRALIGADIGSQHFPRTFSFAGAPWSALRKGIGMLEKVCWSKRDVRQLRAGPLAPHVDSLAALLLAVDEENACSILLCAGRFVEFVASRGVRRRVLTDGDVEAFLVAGSAHSSDAFFAPGVMRHCFQELEIFEEAVPAPGCLVALLTDYDAHLRNDRGISKSVRRSHANVLRLVYAAHRKRRGDAPLADLTGADVLDVFQEVASQFEAVGTRQKFAGELRVLLRYLHFRQLVPSDLASTVPFFINYRLSNVPKHLPWALVQKLIRSIDTEVVPGKRDKAILLLMAGLGLRSGTVSALTLEWIRWRSGELVIPRTKNRRGLNLPLTTEVGNALADYILHERPKTDSRVVFLRHVWPFTPFRSVSTISQMIYSRMDQVGIERRAGANRLLRHSLATRLVNAGVPIKEVSDVMGHRSVDTTAVYTKVDLISLRKVSLPFALGRMP
jgi:integrase/recombinase XerD